MIQVVGLARGSRRRATRQHAEMEIERNRAEMGRELEGLKGLS